MSEFVTPKIGQKVKVVLDRSDYIRTSLVWQPSTMTITGVVVVSEDFDMPRTFRVAAENHTIAVPVIPYQDVIEVEVFGHVVTEASIVASLEQEKFASAFIEAATSKPSNKPVDPDAPVKVSDTVYQVTGSRGDLYTVTKIGDRWICGCIAGLHGKNCKHAKKVELFCNS